MNPFRAVGVPLQLALLSQAAETEKLARIDDETRRLNHIEMLGKAGFEEPDKLLDKLRDLGERVTVNLDDLIRALVKLKQQPESTVALEQGTDRLWKLQHPTYGPIRADNLTVTHEPIVLEQVVLSFSSTTPTLLNEFIRMPNAPAQRSTNKRGQRSQQKPWHPRFRRLA